MYKYEHNLLPSIFNLMYVYNRYFQQVNTRQAVCPAEYRTVLASKISWNFGRGNLDWYIF